MSMTEAGEQIAQSVSIQILNTGLHLTLKIASLTAQSAAHTLNTARTAITNRPGEVSLPKLHKISGGDIHHQKIDPDNAKFLTKELKKNGVHFSIKEGADGNTYAHFSGKDVASMEYAITQAEARLDQKLGRDPQTESKDLDPTLKGETVPPAETQDVTPPATFRAYESDGKGGYAWEEVPKERANAILDYMDAHRRDAPGWQQHQWKNTVESWVGKDPEIDKRLNDLYPGITQKTAEPTTTQDVTSTSTPTDPTLKGETTPSPSNNTAEANTKTPVPERGGPDSNNSPQTATRVQDFADKRTSPAHQNATRSAPDTPDSQTVSTATAQKRAETFAAKRTGAEHKKATRTEPATKKNVINRIKNRAETKTKAPSPKPTRNLKVGPR